MKNIKSLGIFALLLIFLSACSSLALKDGSNILVDVKNVKWYKNRPDQAKERVKYCESELSKNPHMAHSSKYEYFLRDCKNAKRALGLSKD